MKTAQIIYIDTGLSNFAATYIYQEADRNYEPDDEKSYIKPVAGIDKE